MADRLTRWVVYATVVATALVLLHVASTGRTPLNLVQPGELGPSAEVFRQDFPEVDLPEGRTGLDGQQFYVVARNPFDLDAAADHLDRPRYRLQRPLLSWLAWFGHPTGGGVGLIASLFLVGVGAIALLSAAVGELSRRMGGPTWVAAAVGVLPGVWLSLRVTVADTLATGLALGAIALLLRKRTKSSMLAACAAVLAKETAAVLLVGWLIADWRDRRRWYPVVAAAIVGGGWMLYLRVRLPGDEAIGELGPPLAGLIGAARDRWAEGDELWGLFGAVVAAVVTAVALLRGGTRHPLAPALVLQLIFLAFGNADVLGNDFGTARATLPLVAVGMIMSVTPDARFRLGDRSTPPRSGRHADVA